MAIAEMPSHLEHRSMKVLSRCPRLEMSATTVEAVEQAVEEKVIVRPDPIVFDKQQMKKMAELVGLDSKDGLARLFEQLWHTLSRHHQPQKTGRAIRREKRWKPKLQSIPEEI